MKSWALIASFCLLSCFPRLGLGARQIVDEIVFGHYGTGIGEFLYPVCVAITPRDNIVVTDNGKTIRKGDRRVHVHGNVSIFDHEGTFLGPVNPEGEVFGGPAGACYSPNGCLYIVEIERHQVRKFNQTGDQLMVLGGPGRGHGRFRSPRGCVCDAQGHLFVADYRNRRIQEFDEEGQYIRSITWVDPKYDKPAQPRDVNFDPNGRLWAVYTANNKVVRFDAYGDADLIIGEEGSNLGQFDLPRYIAFDVRNAAYISDHKNHRIQKFAEDGRFLYSYGFPGRASGQLNFPEGVAVDRDGNIIIAEAGNKRVQTFVVRKLIRYSNRAFVHFESAELDKAAHWYEKVVELDPANREALAALEKCYTTLGEECMARGDLFGARRLFRKIIRFHPSNVEIRKKIRSTLWLQNKGKLYYLVLGFGIILTMVFLFITMIRIIRSE